jgi:hypothetical protein
LRTSRGNSPHESRRRGARRHAVRLTVRDRAKLNDHVGGARASSRARFLDDQIGCRRSPPARAIDSAIFVDGCRASALVPSRARLIDARVHRACTGSAPATISHGTGLIDSGVDRTSTRCAHARRRYRSRRTRDTPHRNTGRRAIDHRRGRRRTRDATRRNTRRRAGDLRLSDRGNGAEAGCPEELIKSVTHCVLLPTECGRSVRPRIPIAVLILGSASVARLRKPMGYLTSVKRGHAGQARRLPCRGIERNTRHGAPSSRNRLQRPAPTPTPMYAGPRNVSAPRNAELDHTVPGDGRPSTRSLMRPTSADPPT